MENESGLQSVKDESVIEQTINSNDDKSEGMGSDTPLVKPRNRLAVELDRLQQRDEMKERLAKQKYHREVRKLKKKMDKYKQEQGIELYPDIAESKAAIRGIQINEEILALQKDREKLEAETNMLKRHIDDKMGALIREKRPDLTALAEDLFSRTRGNPDIPEHINKALTSEELGDLRQVFDMFDMKGKGYINSKDLKRIINMLGFRAPRKVLDGMIAELAGETERVTFINFLEFIVKGQGDGPDPYEEISQAFSLIDVDDKGFFTFDDLRKVIDESKLNFSNSMLKEMMEDADKTGDGKISKKEFMDIMIQTSTFKLVSSASRLSSTS